ncbi:MAG TPA: phosphoribosylformylglycinamidine cyclo-ligase [Casimicrobiaceae bacterium]|nr:phosphoribosylformylglycinamidine cyclo-ligase [Casimicrobiaceae bacterium]
MAENLTYRAAGVDIDAGDALVERIKPHARRTMRPEVLAGIGGFGALVEIGKRFRNPVLVASTDGVGTKLKLAFALDGHDTIGIDLVAMSVNDVLVQGAEPLFFLDYFACGRLDVDVATRVVRGIAVGCETAGCALIGGETAEMPGMYVDGEYDLAGFAVGVVEKDAIIDGRNVVAGDAVLGLASSGTHSNGYSLIRRIVDEAHADLASPLSGAAMTIGEALLAPTRIYVKPLLALARKRQVKAMAHVTGGGLIENVPRVLPPKLAARIDAASWKRPPIFDWLQQAGRVTDGEMHRVFNCGIGMVVIVAAKDVDAVITQLSESGERVWKIGEIVPRADGDAATTVG